MDRKMFCYQCEQTAGGTGCCGNAGACGKTAATAEIQDKISGALIGLARTAQSAEKENDVYELIIRALFTTVTNVNFDDEDLNKLIAAIEAKGAEISKEGNTVPYATYDITKIWAEQEDIRALKSMLLFGLRGMAAYAFHAAQLGRTNDELAAYFCKGLALLSEDHSLEEWVGFNMELGKYNLLTMEL
ncbi:MAG: hydroxylamine reductase, partial [Firmicutes bacterium]|nr:hydroxylamine reductase [Bacillota bacterium]